MDDFLAKLKLKGKADEDLYFAKKDKELIRALHRKKLAKLAKCDIPDGKKHAEAFEQRFEKITKKHKKRPRKLLQRYRELIDDIRDFYKRRCR
jgi:nitrogenase molybdenum-iron protein alpha/beta subunit